MPADADGSVVGERNRPDSRSESERNVASSIHVRLAVLLGLVLVGVGIAAVGSALGVGESLTGSEPDAQFTVSDDTVTFTDGEVEVTAVENLTQADAIEIVTDDDEFHVRVEFVESLTHEERERAIELARTDETIRNALGNPDDYEFTAERGRYLGAGDAEIGSGVTVYERDSDTEYEFSEVVSGDGEESVTVVRQPPAADYATVRIVDSAGDLQYAVVVNLTTEQVVDIVAT